jgi:hypothetical protein
MCGTRPHMQPKDRCMWVGGSSERRVVAPPAERRGPTCRLHARAPDLAKRWRATSRWSGPRHRPERGHDKGNGSTPRVGVTRGCTHPSSSRPRFPFPHSDHPGSRSRASAASTGHTGMTTDRDRCAGGEARPSGLLASGTRARPMAPIREGSMSGPLLRPATAQVARSGLSHRERPPTRRPGWSPPWTARAIDALLRRLAGGIPTGRDARRRRRGRHGHRRPKPLADRTRCR